MDYGMVSARREPPDAPPPHTAGPNQLNYSSRVPSASHKREPRLSVCRAASERGLPVREVPSWDYWGCGEVAACEGRAETREDPGDESKEGVSSMLGSEKFTQPQQSHSVLS